MESNKRGIGIIFFLICSSQGLTYSPSSTTSLHSPSTSSRARLAQIHPLACINVLGDLKDVEPLVGLLEHVLEALLGNLVTLVLSMADCASDPSHVFEMLQCFIEVLEDSGPDTEVFLHAFYNLTVSSQQIYQEIAGDFRECIGDSALELFES